MGKEILELEKELLLSLYWGNLYSTRGIGDLFNTNHQVIRRRMNKYKIPIRNRSDAGKLLENKHAIGKKPWNYGITHNEDSRIINGSRVGSWKGGISSENERMRRCKKFYDWRKSIFKRDKYTCKRCGERKRDLNAHHIKSFAEYPELRLDVNNGITLCRDCHINIHSKV